METTPIKKTGIKIGNYLRKYRMDKGYSQEVVAEMLGVSQKTYSNMENNRSEISIETIKKLIDLYQIDMENVDITKLITEGKIVQRENKFDNGSVGINIETSEEIKNHYKEIIANYKQIIEEKNNRIAELENLFLKG